MKKVLYIYCFVGLFLTLQSCDRLSGLFGDDNDSRQEQVADEQEQDGSVNNDKQISDSTNKAATEKMQSQLQQNEDGIKKLNDSLDILNSKMANLQSDIATLKQQQKDLEDDKVGVKNLFVYLAMFSVVAIVIVVLLSKKITGKGSLTEKQIKGIIADFARNRPDIINGSMQLELSKHIGNIQKNTQAINAINMQLGALIKYVNEVSTETSNQQSWESQVTLKGKTDDGGKHVEKSSKVFYMEQPRNDMEFDLSLKKGTPTEDTLYRFEVDDKRPNFARFVFDCSSVSGVRWALRNKDKTLDRVCHTSGSGTNGKYTCTAPGEAELRDGKWVVTRKAVVIFD